MGDIRVFHNANCKRSMRTVVAATFALMASMNDLSAAEIKVQCGDAIITVNTSANSVEYYVDSNTYSYANNKPCRIYRGS